jgi:excisionase family DNA binding protein
VRTKTRGAAALAELTQAGRLFASPDEVAAVLELERKTIYLALERGEIPFTRIGQRYQIPVAWLVRQAEGKPEPAEQIRS